MGIAPIQKGNRKSFQFAKHEQTLTIESPKGDCKGHHALY